MRRKGTGVTMKLSRTEANWIASRLLSDAEQERERVVGRRTAWLTILFPALAFVRPTERVSALRDARVRAAREWMILWPSIGALLLFAALYFAIPRHLGRAWLGLVPGAIIAANLFAQYLRTRAILEAEASRPRDHH